MISIAWISLPPETLRRLVDEQDGGSRCRRWERLAALGVFAVIFALGMAASLFAHR
jgi:hypothetical protein